MAPASERHCSIPEFEVLVDAPFTELFPESELTPICNKSVVSIINDFEDTKWRYEKFQNFIWDNITQTALSYEERQCLIDQSHSSLTQAAKKLRLTDQDSADIGRGSEVAEIALYGLMKNYYSALPVVPKIFYKQNTQDYAKGADSVHVVVEGDNFSVWFGEAKFYKSIDNASLAKIVESVKNSLGTEKLKKENSIITGVSDIRGLVSDEGLLKKISDALSNKVSIDELKPRIHIPILILHECAITKQQQSMSQEYKDALIAHHKNRAEAYFKKQIEKCTDIHMYSEIKFHLLLFPIPEKDKIVHRFLSMATALRGED